MKSRQLFYIGSAYDFYKCDFVQKFLSTLKSLGGNIVMLITFKSASQLNGDN